MKIDYHMHFEYGSYDEDWVQGFFDAAAKRGIDEIGITEHSHTFPEFQALYYEDLVLDDSFVGSFQQKWLKKNKFKYTLDEYFAFMEKLKAKHAIKTGIEVCNFQDQDKVRDILKGYDFDYIIGSVHFLRGWAYDSSEIKDEWNRHGLEEIYAWYAEEVEKLAKEGPTPEELVQAKKSLVESLPSLFDSPASTASIFAKGELLGKTDNHYIDYVTEINAVTAEQVKAMIAKYFDKEKMTISIVGPVAMFDSLKPFTVVPLDSLEFR